MILRYKIQFLKNFVNKSIAATLNQVFEYATENKYEWVLTLDQSSVCPDGLIVKYKGYIDYENVGIISPVTAPPHLVRTAQNGAV